MIVASAVHYMIEQARLPWATFGSIFIWPPFSVVPFVSFKYWNNEPKREKGLKLEWKTNDVVADELLRGGSRALISSFWFHIVTDTYMYDAQRDLLLILHIYNNKRSTKS